MATRTPRQIDRIAPARVIADAESALYAAYEYLEEPLQSLKNNAVRKAGDELFRGLRLQPGNKKVEVRSRSREKTHTVSLENGQYTCTCEACAEQEQPCWHIEAVRLTGYILDSQQEEPEPETKVVLVEKLGRLREDERQRWGQNSIPLTRSQVETATRNQIDIWIAAAESRIARHAYKIYLQEQQPQQTQAERQAQAQAALEECYP